MYFARQVVTERLRQVDLPDGVVSVLGPQITPLGEVYQFTVDGGGKSPTELRTLLDWTIVPFLKQVPGVADIVAQGGFRKEIHILVGPDRLKAHGITLTTVYEALSRSNANIGAGHIRHGQEQYIVRGLGLLRSPDDIKEIVLTAEKGTPVRIKEVATLVEANTPRQGAVGRGVNLEAVEGFVLMRRGENPSIVLEQVRQLGERRPDPHRVPIVIAQAAKEVAVPTLFSLVIIMAALIPIYAFQRVEGRIFKPMAYTYAFALTGALLFSFTAVLAMAALLIKRAPHGELESWFMVAARRVIEPLVAHALRLRKVVLFGLVALLLASGFLLTRLGTEFLPVLNEGDLHVYVEMPNSIALPEGQRLLAEIRRLLAQFPEVADVLSEQGRPEDGTDTIGPNQSETFIHLHPEEDWTAGRTKVRLVEAMPGEVTKIPGVMFNFSQPIADNVEEAISGIRGQVVIKVFGEDNEVLQAKAAEILAALKTVREVRDPAIYRTGKIPNLLIELDRPQIARHGLTVTDIERVIETAVGGRVATDYWEGEKRFGVRVLLAEPSRATASRIGEITIGTPDGSRIRLDTFAKIRVADGRAQIWRQNNSKFVAVKCNIGDRDMGSFVAEAMAKVAASIKIPEGYYLTWGGEFENQQRAMARLQVVVPVAILAVMALLYFAFGSFRDSLLIILVAPCAFIGGIVTLWLTGTVFSVSAAVGLIALMGQTVLNGVLLVATFRQLQQEEEPMTLNDLIRKGVNMRLRALLMTALLARLGLLPAALSHGIGSETQRPFALVIIGGIVTSTALTLFLIPVLFSFRIFAKVERPGVVPHPASVTPMMLLLLGLLAVPASATAQDRPTTMMPAPSAEPVTTLGAAFKAYEAGNLERKSAQALVESARQQVRAAGLLENPTISHSQGHNSTGTPTGRAHQ